MHDDSENAKGRSHFGMQEQPQRSQPYGEDLFGEPVLDQSSVIGRPRPRNGHRPLWKPADHFIISVRLTNRAANVLELWLAEQPHQARSASEAVNMALESLISFDAAQLDAAAVKLDGQLADLRAQLHVVKLAISGLQSISESTGAAQ
jgi:hypothetical protein